MNRVEDARSSKARRAAPARRQRPVWERRALKTVQVLGVALLCLAPLGARPARAMTDQEEIDLGKEVARKAAEEFGGALPANDPRSVRVRRLGEPFARMSTRRAIPFTYTVLNNKKVLNAFATPGGAIFVTSRLVEVTGNDAELAFALGHETGHIEKRHTAQTIEKRQAAQDKLARWGDKILGHDAQRTRKALALAASVAYFMMTRGYAKAQETEADEWGARSMSKLGFDPRAGASLLGKIAEEEGQQGEPGALSTYLSSHPDPKARQAHILDLISQEGLLAIARQNGGPRLQQDGPAVPGAPETPNPNEPKSSPEPDPGATDSGPGSLSTPEPPQTSATPASTSQAPSGAATPDATGAPTDASTDDPTKPGSAWPLAFLGGGALLLAGALYFWFSTAPGRSASTSATPATAGGSASAANYAGASSSGASASGRVVLATAGGQLFDIPMPSALGVSPSVVAMGRGASCDVRVEDAQVSQRHAEITFDGHAYRLRDCNSSNGTFLNGARITEALLQMGDTIMVGQTTLSVHSLQVLAAPRVA